MERKIIIGLITDTDFLKEFEEEWNPEYIEGRAAKLLSAWCWEYYKKYKEAPMQDIESIYITKLRQGLDEDLANEIEEDILPSLNEEYEKGTDNIYLIDETRAFFKERQIQIHTDSLTYLLDKGEIKEAQTQIDKFEIKTKVENVGLDLSSPESLMVVRQAFDQTFQNVIKFPGALGEFWNNQLVRGGLVSLLGIEKRGKTFWLLEFMMLAYRQKRKVAFFQAGDMTEAQQIVRIGVYLAQRSNLEQYIGVRHIPQMDCIHNQKDTCNKKVRECNFGLFGEEMNTRDEITKEDLVEACESNPDYKPCYNCTEWKTSKWGTPWLSKQTIRKPLTKTAAVREWEKFFIKAGRSIKLSTHDNGTLTVTGIEKVLDKWERDDFVPDVVLVDYGDLLVPEIKGDFRHQEDHKWKRLRGLSQKTNALWIVPTQADADGYDKNTLTMKNFNEDKRKNAHVTAMYGLNQDKDGREKEIGIMRINEIVVRDGDFHPSHQVYVLQHLAIGRPHLGSYL